MTGWRRREVIGGAAALAVIPAQAQGKRKMAEQNIAEWDALVEGLRPLGGQMMARLPARLRDDPQVVQESLRLLMGGLQRALTDAIIGDPRHPFFVPELSITQNIFQPNADTVYKSAMIDGAGSYRIKGNRGTTRMFVLAQLGPDTIRTGKHAPALFQYDFDDLALDRHGDFDVIISQKRPADWEGDWWELSPNAEKFMIRIVGCDWGLERESRIGIDRLDVPASAGRRSATDLSHRLSEIATITRNCAMAFPDKVEQIRAAGHINTLNVVDFAQMTGLARQSYYEGAYDLADDEALITEVKIPAKVDYWSLILTNELYETTDWMNNQSSLNAAQAHVDSDGIFRAVISARDPGVANWLDTSGFARGAVQGRWFGADERPTPTMVKVKLAEVVGKLPKGTKMMSAKERDAAMRERRLRAHQRVIW
jgi:Protein of unknown function (DUF1214)